MELQTSDGADFAQNCNLITHLQINECLYGLANGILHAHAICREQR